MMKYDLYKKISIKFHNISNLECVLCHRRCIHNLIPGLCNLCFSNLENEILNACLYFKEIPVYALFEYKGKAKQLIKQAKFKNCSVSAFVIASLTVLICSNKIGSRNFLQPFEKPACCFDFINSVLMPVPCSKESIIQRGWDLSQWISFELMKYFEIESYGFIFRNTRNNIKQQKKLNRKDRLILASNKFRSSKKIYKVESNKIIILDDDMTTGATLKSCYDIVNHNYNNKKIMALVFCCD